MLFQGCTIVNVLFITVTFQNNAAKKYTTKNNNKNKLRQNKSNNYDTRIIQEKLLYTIQVKAV